MSKKQGNNKENSGIVKIFDKKNDGEIVLGMKSKEFATLLDRNSIKVKPFYDFCIENNLTAGISYYALKKMRSAPNQQYKTTTEIPPMVVNALLVMLGRDLFVALREDYAQKNSNLEKTLPSGGNKI